MPTHAGFYSTTISGTVVNGDNVNFGTLQGAQGELTVAGNFAIANGNGFPLVQIQAGTIVSPLGTLSIGYTNPNITIDLAGGSPASSFGVDAFTAPGTNPVLPTVGGLVTFTGAQVAAGTIPTAIRTDSLAANTMTIEVQRTSQSPVSNAALNGVAHFDSAFFSVDPNGLVTFSGSASITWQDFAPGALSISNGYFATGAGAYTLPLGVSDGETIEIIDNIGGGVVVTAAGAQTIRVQNVNSSAGGTCTSTQFGDALRLIFRASIGEWQCCPGGGGNWLLA